jgi:hypothetical protein
MNTTALTALCTTDEVLVTDAARERIGEKAFRFIIGEVRGHRLTPDETVQALGLLVRLTDLFCVRRKGDLVALAAQLAERDDTHHAVRSKAARIVTSVDFTGRQRSGER